MAFLRLINSFKQNLHAVVVVISVKHFLTKHKTIINLENFASALLCNEQIALISFNYLHLLGTTIILSTISWMNEEVLLAQKVQLEQQKFTFVQ